MSRPSFVVLAITALAGCGAGRQNTHDLTARPSSTGSRAITREMIARWNVLDAYDVIQRSGGYKLSSNGGGNVGVTQRRGQTSLKSGNADHPVLLLDGAIMRDYDMLRQVRASQIERIDFLSPADATQRYGTSSSGAGAIIIRTRGGS